MASKTTVSLASNCLGKTKRNANQGYPLIKSSLAPLNEQELTSLSQSSQSYALSNGFVFRKTPELSFQGETGANVGILSHTLYAQPFSRNLFQHLQRHTLVMNSLLDKMSRDSDFLASSLEDCGSKGDVEFTGKLLDLFRRAKSKQKFHLGIYRNDFMMHSNDGHSIVPQQVEINTIVTGATVMSALLHKLHMFLYRKSETIRQHLQQFGKNGAPEPVTSLKGITNALQLAHHTFMQQELVTADCILFVVQPLHKIKFLIDQIGIEQVLEEQYNIRVIRLTLTEIMDRCSLEPETGHLLIDNKIRVSVAYFRSGFTPQDFPSLIEWEARELLEKSTAIKAPTLSIQLLGTKKMQQIMSQPDVLERYISPDEASFIRSYYTGLYSLSNPSDSEHVRDAIDNYSDYVLKPQREGGGDLVHGVALKTLLETISDEDRDKYILMRRIKPFAFDTHTVKHGIIAAERSTFELGIYGFYLGDGERSMLNEVNGYLLRTKREESVEGGLAIGISAIDSLYLVDQEEE